MSTRSAFLPSLAIVSNIILSQEPPPKERPLVDPVLGRRNLVVFSGGLVTKLGLHKTSAGITAYGVYVRFPDGTEELARLAPGGEVIMSAGTVRTPQLLELSGIGDKDILNKYNISVLLDLPAVGTNYEDQ